MSGKKTKLLVSASLVPIAMSAAVTAQAQNDVAAAGADADRRLSVITVTSQKREQSLQGVPVVVTALESGLIEDAGVRDIKDLTVLTPGLIVT